MTPSCLFVIDVQRGFVNQWTRDIPARVAALQDRFGHVVVTRFVNPEGSLYRSLMGWQRFAPDSEDAELAFDPRRDAVHVEKAQYSSLTDDCRAFLSGHAFGRIHLCGIATENCVLKTAVDLFEAGIVPVVLSDYCASHGGPDCHQAGLTVLRRFIGPAQVASGEPRLS